MQIADEAVAACRAAIASAHGSDYIPDSPRIYKTKAKNAQEAHEAIRPTDVHRDPASIRAALDADQAKLYDLVWRRTLASQMASARLEQTTADMASGDGRTGLRATGTVVRFPGFLALYQEGKDEKSEEDEKERRLPALGKGEDVAREGVTPKQHFTQPPPRYSEASLVRRMEELGIGRPSTYASILQVLQDRNYVQLDRRRFVPEDRGRLVTSFLSSFFKRYVEYGFTADLEGRLDDISGGRIGWKEVLKDFWQAFSKAVEETKDLKIRDVLDALDQELAPHFFPSAGEGEGADPRLCPSCEGGRLSLKLGKYGAFIGCSNYPDCRYTRRLGIAGNGAEEAAAEGPIVLGTDPETGLEVSLRKGPFGHYVQLGEAQEGEKPKRASLPKGDTPTEMTLERALGLLSLPREIGAHPESGEMILAGIGRYGPYVKHGKTFKSLDKDDDVLAVGINRAVALLAEAPRGRAAAPGKEIGKHPSDEEPVTLHSGRYGPYVQHGKIRATLPRDTDPESLTIETAIQLIDAKAAKGPAKKPAKKAAAKKTAAKKTTTKKAPAKKAGTKKPAAKKAAGTRSAKGKDGVNGAGGGSAGNSSSAAD